MSSELSLFSRFCTYISRWTHIPQQLIRFVLIGCLNAAFAYSVYCLFIFIGFHYTLAVFLSTIIGICFSFKTMGRFVFDNTDNKLIFKFFAVYGFCYFLNIGILKLLTECGVHNLYLAGLISSGLVALVSFCLNKWVVFKKK